jgi:hypothetical protein
MAGMPAQAVSRARNLIILLVIALLLGAAISLYENLVEVDAQYRELARGVAQSFFQAVMAMRDWNSAHQGVYVTASPDARPDEFLVDAARDVTTTQGIRLTKINHAQMTRMIADLLDKQEGVHVHITSLTPLRPQNSPDAWERAALLGFASGLTEKYDVQANAAGKEEFRYMAPLKVESSCMNCHHEHKSLQEVRGGLSVSLGYSSFRQLMDKANRQIWLVHVLGLCASLVLVVYLGRKLVQNCSALQASLLRVRQLEGLVPVCANCKKIRTEGMDSDVQTSWIPMELYLEARTNAEFTHGLCPDCREKLYPEMPSGRKA